MPTIPNLEGFPFQVRQKDEDSCIPANIEAVTKYFIPDSQVTQDYIWKRLYEENPREGISFATVKKHVLDKDIAFRKLTSEHCNVVFPESLSWICETATLKPVMLSLPARTQSGRWTGKWHVITLLGHDEGSFHVYNPDPCLESPYDVPMEGFEQDLFSAVGRRETDSLIVSAL